MKIRSIELDVLYESEGESEEQIGKAFRQLVAETLPALSDSGKLATFVENPEELDLEKYPKALRVIMNFKAPDEEVLDAND